MGTFLRSIDRILLSMGTFDPSTITGAKSGSDFDNITTSIENGGNNIIYIMMMVGGFIAAIGLGVAFIKIMAGGSVTKSEAKSQLLWIIGAGIGIFAVVGIVGVLYSIGSGLFG